MVTKGELEQALAAREWEAGADSAGAAAAVAVCVGLTAADEAFLVLTRRGQRLRSHPGQWALPGGRRDPGETPEQTARRELAEEIGLELAEDAVLGRLDDFVTRSGYVISPIVMWAGAIPDELEPNADEVAEVHRIPLSQFDAVPRFLTIPESPRPVFQLPFNGRYLHAPTGAIIHQFCQLVLHNEYVRVADYEQPVWAWR